MQMLLYYREIQQFLGSYTMFQFSNDVKTIRAVSNNLICIGELTNGIQTKIKEKYPNIPWKSLKFIRNHLAHYNNRISNKRLWDIATQQLPTIMHDINNLSMDLAIQSQLYL